MGVSGKKSWCFREGVVLRLEKVWGFQGRGGCFRKEESVFQGTCWSFREEELVFQGRDGCFREVVGVSGKGWVFQGSCGCFREEELVFQSWCFREGVGVLGKKSWCFREGVCVDVARKV